MEEFFVNLMYCIGALALFCIGFLLIAILVRISLHSVSFIIDWLLDLRDIWKKETRK